MGERTIPEPTDTDIAMQTSALRFSVERAGLDWDDPQVRDLAIQCIKVQAQMNAEIRFLRNIIHDPRNCKSLKRNE